MCYVIRTSRDQNITSAAFCFVPSFIRKYSKVNRIVNIIGIIDISHEVFSAQDLGGIY